MYASSGCLYAVVTGPPQGQKCRPVVARGQGRLTKLMAINPLLEPRGFLVLDGLDKREKDGFTDTETGDGLEYTVDADSHAA